MREELQPLGPVSWSRNLQWRFGVCRIGEKNTRLVRPELRVKSAPVIGESSHTYPYFGLRECHHCEICHDPLGRGESKAELTSGGIRKEWLTKLLNPPFKPKKRSG